MHFNAVWPIFWSYTVHVPAYLILTNMTETAYYSLSFFSQSHSQTHYKIPKNDTLMKEENGLGTKERENVA